MIYETIIRRTPIDKGWSGDQKYCAVTEDGSKYLLRLSDSGLYDRRKREFTQMQQAAALNISMCRPVEFGTSVEGVYSLHTWIDGRDAEQVIPRLPEKTQYQYGIQAGIILKKIHSIPAPEGQPDWAEYFDAKAQRKIKAYRECGLQYSCGESMVQYLMKNRQLLQNRPVTYQHGDYHIGNMMIDHTGKLYVIDFEKDDFGDPWEEFNRIVWCAQASPAFARGILDGYFENRIPELFWKLLAYYICSNAIGSLPWAISYGQQEVDTITKQGEEILSWYNNMNEIIPSWYRKEE